MRFLISLFLVINLMVLSQAGAAQVSKSDWLAAMPTALSAYFCKDDQYFRQCFEVTRVKCEAVVESHSEVCLKKFQPAIPDVLNQPQDGTQWGQVVGQCVGQAYDVSLIDSRISNPTCNDPMQWQ